MFDAFGLRGFVPHTKIAGFVAHLREGRLMASVCRACGAQTFPPQADCPGCANGDFEFREILRTGTLHTFTEIVAAPQGFESLAPFVLGLIDLDAGGRLLAPIGESIAREEIAVGLRVAAVPRIIADAEPPRVTVTLESPSTTPRSSQA